MMIGSILILNFLQHLLYENLSGFYREVEQQGYKITYKNLDENFVDTLVNEGKLYSIYTRTFPFSKGTPNMHTLYWKALFEEENHST